MSGVTIDSSAAAESRRQRLRRLFEGFRAHLQRRWFWWAVATIPPTLVGGFCGISFNVLTDSLPHKAYLLLYFDRMPQRGQYYAFSFPGGGPYWPDAPFVKEFAGVPGDTVSTVGREVFVNARSVGIAKERSRTGYPLAMVSPGVIPPGMYYVYAPHPDSLDSRYAMVGLISGRRVIGRAVPLW